jgi:hypothetical protein
MNSSVWKISAAQFSIVALSCVSPDFAQGSNQGDRMSL